MPATLTRQPLDLATAGLLLVAEVEDYLRSVAAPVVAAGPGRLDLARLLTAAGPVCQYGSVVQSWHAGFPAPSPTVLDRLRHRAPVLDVTPGEHLQLTSRYITAHGWTQHTLWDSSGRVCILGAQVAVLAAGYGTEATVRRARMRIGNELGHLGQPMPVDTWNDAPGRRQADVHRLLERAAAR